MLVFYLTIPFMLLGAAIAVVPLIFAIRHQQQWEEATAPAIRPGRKETDPLAA